PTFCLETGPGQRRLGPDLGDLGPSAAGRRPGRLRRMVVEKLRESRSDLPKRPREPIGGPESPYPGSHAGSITRAKEPVAVSGVSVDGPQHRGDGPVTVLVVEDDPAITRQLVRGLKLSGYETSSVATGADALGRPAADVALLDLGLPDIDGVEVCR